MFRKDGLSESVIVSSDSGSYFLRCRQGTHFSSSTGHLSFPSWNMVVRFTPLLQRPACVFSIPCTTPESAWLRVLSDLLQFLASLSKQASCLLICVVIRSCSVVGSGYNAFLSLSTVSWSYRILVCPLLLLDLVFVNLLGFGLSPLWRHYLFLLFLSALTGCQEFDAGSSRCVHL